MGTGVAVGSGVGVAVGTGAAVGSGVGVAVGTGVAVGSGVGVAVGAGVAVGSGVGVNGVARPSFRNHGWATAQSPARCVLLFQTCI